MYIKSGTTTSFLYNASGNRVREQTGVGVARVYIRDVQGNIQAIYENGVCVERPLYGSSRLGRLNGVIAGTTTREYRQTGITEYEVPDHLGNVRAVVGDVRLTTGEVESSVLYYYYPYGFLREGGSYRYGYNGMQREDAIAGAGNTYTTEHRMFSSLYGRWFSIDPLAEQMPSWSPYSFGFANPLRYVDITGLIPTPKEGAAIAGHIYYGKVGEVVSGWKLEREFTYNNLPGFRAGLYSKENNGVVEYALANAGTYPELSEKMVGTIYEDLVQPFGFSKHIKQSMELAKKVNKEYAKSELTFLGHSKGGTEATANALATGRNALLYNPAALASKEYGLNVHGYTGVDGHGMKAYVVEGDFLHQYINSWSAKPIGELIMLPRQSESGIENHSLESVRKGLIQRENMQILQRGVDRLQQLHSSENKK